MQFHLANQSIVIIANNFNPSLFNQIWLVENGIIGDKEDFKQGCVFSDTLVQVNTTQFKLLVVPQQLQFTVNPDNDTQQVINSDLKKIIELLPHTPYTAIGINFVWNVYGQNETLANLTRRLFFRNDISLLKTFDEPNANFGIYVSKNIAGIERGRLKLNVLPIKQIKIQDKKAIEEEAVQLSFNFHLDISNKKIESITNFLSKYSVFSKEAESITNSIQ